MTILKYYNNYEQIVSNYYERVRKRGRELKGKLGV